MAARKRAPKGPMRKRVDRQMRKAVNVAWERVANAEQRMDAFMFATSGLVGGIWSVKIPDESLAAVRGALAQNLNEAYQALFMFGVLDPRARKRARAKLMKEFLADDMAVMQYLSPQHSHPGQWLSEDEDEFREDIKEAMRRSRKAEKGGEE